MQATKAVNGKLLLICCISVFPGWINFHKLGLVALDSFFLHWSRALAHVDKFVISSEQFPLARASSVTESLRDAQNTCAVTTACTVRKCTFRRNVYQSNVYGKAKFIRCFSPTGLELFPNFLTWNGLLKLAPLLFGTIIYVKFLLKKKTEGEGATLMVGAGYI